MIKYLKMNSNHMSITMTKLFKYFDYMGLKKWSYIKDIDRTGYSIITLYDQVEDSNLPKKFYFNNKSYILYYNNSIYVSRNSNTFKEFEEFDHKAYLYEYKLYYTDIRKEVLNKENNIIYDEYDIYYPCVSKDPITRIWNKEIHRYDAPKYLFREICDRYRHFEFHSNWNPPNDDKFIIINL